MKIYRPNENKKSPECFACLFVPARTAESQLLYVTEKLSYTKLSAPIRAHPRTSNCAHIAPISYPSKLTKTEKCHETALEMVYRADFWCNQHSFASPIHLWGSRGRLENPIFRLPRPSRAHPRPSTVPISRPSTAPITRAHQNGRQF